MPRVFRTRLSCYNYKLVLEEKSNKMKRGNRNSLFAHDGPRQLKQAEQNWLPGFFSWLAAAFFSPLIVASQMCALFSSPAAFGI